MAEKKITERLKELKALSAGELEAAILNARKAIYNVRRDRLSKPVTDVKATKTARKEIARIKTIQRERELKEAK